MLVALLLLAAQAQPSLVERFQNLAAAEQQVGRCAHLDRSAATRARVMRARTAAASVAARAKAASVAGRRAWAAMKDGVDDSCIVGPDETDAESYRFMIDHYEQTTRDVTAALPKPRSRGR